MKYEVQKERLLTFFYFEEKELVNFLTEHGHIIREWKERVRFGTWMEIWRPYKYILTRYDELMKRVELAEWKLHHFIANHKKEIPIEKPINSYPFFEPINQS